MSPTEKKYRTKTTATATFVEFIAIVFLFVASLFLFFLFYLYAELFFLSSLFLWIVFFVQGMEIDGYIVNEPYTLHTQKKSEKQLQPIYVVQLKRQIKCNKLR